MRAEVGEGNAGLLEFSPQGETFLEPLARIGRAASAGEAAHGRVGESNSGRLGTPSGVARNGGGNGKGFLNSSGGSGKVIGRSEVFGEARQGDDHVVTKPGLLGLGIGNDSLEAGGFFQVTNGFLG